MSEQQNQAGKYTVYHAEYSAIGDWANVNNYLSAQAAAADPGVAELRRLFEEVNRRLDALEQADRELLTPAVQQAAEAAAAIQAGDESETRQNFLLTRLRHIAAMAPDIAQVIIATLASPATGLALVLQKIAQKAQAQLAGQT